MKPCQHQKTSFLTTNKKTPSPPSGPAKPMVRSTALSEKKVAFSTHCIPRYQDPATAAFCTAKGNQKSHQTVQLLSFIPIFHSLRFSLIESIARKGGGFVDIPPFVSRLLIILHGFSKLLGVPNSIQGVQAMVLRSTKAWLKRRRNFVSICKGSLLML